MKRRRLIAPLARCSPLVIARRAARERVDAAAALANESERAQHDAPRSFTAAMSCARAPHMRAASPFVRARDLGERRARERNKLSVDKQSRSSHDSKSKKKRAELRWPLKPNDNDDDDDDDKRDNDDDDDDARRECAPTSARKRPNLVPQRRRVFIVALSSGSTNIALSNARRRSDFQRARAPASRRHSKAKWRSKSQEEASKKLRV